MSRQRAGKTFVSKFDTWEILVQIHLYGFICKFEFSDFCMAFSVLFGCVTITYTPSTLWSRCTPITLLNRPHAAYCLVVIYFPHPYPYILLMYFFFLGGEEDKAFFVKPKTFVDVDETFRTYSSPQIN